MYVHPSRLPSYRIHKPTGQAVATIGGRDVYLGKYESRRNRTEYDRIIAEWLSAGRRLRRPEPMPLESVPGQDGS